MREDALFRIVSMTKPITSIAFMQLVEQGKIALDDPVARVLPELADLGTYAGGGGGVPFAPAKRGVPMRFVDLMTHSAPYLRIPEPYQRRCGLSRCRTGSGAKAVRFRRVSRNAGLGSARIRAGNGLELSVSTDVLGIAVERLSGKSLGAYFAEHIFDPLGVVDTAFDVTPAQQPRLADAYAYCPGKSPKPLGKGFNFKLGEAARFHSGGGGLEGTIADYHRFAAMLLGKGR